MQGERVRKGNHHKTSIVMIILGTHLAHSMSSTSRAGNTSSTRWHDEWSAWKPVGNWENWNYLVPQWSLNSSGSQAPASSDTLQQVFS